MAQPVRRPRQRTQEPTLQSIQQELTEIKDMLRNMMEVLQQAAAAGRSAGAVRPMTRPTPRRVEQHSYRVTVGDRTYRVTLPERLPARGARERLHDLLLGNQLVDSEGERVTVHADVQQVGGPGSMERFNGRPPNARLDIFRDDYLARTFRDGHYVPNREVRVAQGR